MPINDLVILVADKNMKFAVEGILTRQKSLNIRSIKSFILVHPERDPGCLFKGSDLLRQFIHEYKYALMIFDLEGCGKEDKNKNEIEKEVENKLHSSGWDNRAVAIAIDPELEIWVWSESKQVDSALGWKDKNTSLRDWLRENNFLRNNQIKPGRPKEALEAVLREVYKPRSSSLYEDLAKKVSLEGCSDEAFNKLKRTLQKWFPASKAKNTHP